MPHIKSGVNLESNFEKLIADLDKLPELRMEYSDTYALGYISAAVRKHILVCTTEESEPAANPDDLLKKIRLCDVYNEHTLEVEFTGTHEECQTFLGNYGGGWAAMKIGPHISEEQMNKFSLLTKLSADDIPEELFRSPAAPVDGNVSDNSLLHY